MNEVCERLVKRWNAPNGRPMSGHLIERSKTPNEPDCMCAQGWALFESGMTFKEIQEINQASADIEVAKRLEISLAHSILLRRINDSRPDSPSVVLTNPTAILGDQSDLVLKFWHHLDSLDWAAARYAAGTAAGTSSWHEANVAVLATAGVAAVAAALYFAQAAVWNAAWEAAFDPASWNNSWKAARVAAADAAGAATLEIQWQKVMRELDIPFFYLPLLGFASPDQL